MKYFIYGLLAVALVAGCTQAFAVPTATQCKHAKKGITPIQSCVIARPMIESMVVEPDPQPVVTTVVTKYVYAEVQPCGTGMSGGFAQPSYSSFAPVPIGGSRWASIGGSTHHFNAPEIDPDSAIAAITLLLGALAVIVDRRCHV